MPLTVCIIFLVVTFALLSLWFFIRAKVKRNVLKCEDDISDVLSANILQESGGSKSTISLHDYVDQRFANQYIRPEEQASFVKNLTENLDDVLAVNRSRRMFAIGSDIIEDFVWQFESLDRTIEEHNQRYCKNQLADNEDFFDTVLQYPLDKQQRHSIVSEAENCLVVSSAGSGKTSSIVGKVRYLIDKKHVEPERILLISYTNKAAAELTERLNAPGLRGYTFHKLAIDIIGQMTKHKPSICENVDNIFVDIYKLLLEDKDFQDAVVSYFANYEIEHEDWEKRKADRQQNLSAAKASGYKALLPDMDGKAIHVRSEQEKSICFALSSLGVSFRYEEAYEHPVYDELHSQYRPDFSIHYTKDGKDSRVYLEHFGIDEHGTVPAWFAKNKGITWEEANKRYGDGITWKRELHQEKGTTLLETTSADFSRYDIKEKLKKILSDAGVPFRELSSNELYTMLLPKGSKQEKSFIRLIVTFATLLKTNCKSIDEVVASAHKERDKRAEFIIENIFAPVVARYQEALTKLEQWDFTDVILEATSLISSSPLSRYDYIIVDEFQDISIDRYKFLQELRKGEPQARLYCVGDDWQSIYRFSGSDMALFNRFEDFFGPTEIDRIETTYRFGQPCVSLSSNFVQRNPVQLKKNIRPFSDTAHTGLLFQAYERAHYVETLTRLIATIPQDKKIYLLGRYSFDDYYLSFAYKGYKRGNQFFYNINGREIEFLTVHKSKGLEADVVILLQCNKDVFGFPSMMSDDPVLKYVLSRGDEYPFGEERRLFYVAITRAKEKTYVMYDQRFPSIFIDELLHPEVETTTVQTSVHRNANKHWGPKGDAYLRQLYREGKTPKEISKLMGRSYTSIIMRLQKLGELQ